MKTHQLIGTILILALSTSGSIHAAQDSELRAHYSPEWSPDGDHIVFNGYVCNDEPRCNYDIFLMDTDGENLINLTNTPDVNELGPRWSPDGKHIAFVNKINDEAYGIFVMNSAGSDSLQLGSYPKSLVDQPANGNVFDWSPNGEKLVFVSEYEENYHLYRVDIDGSNLTRLTQDSANHLSPDWSPDGTQITFILVQNSHDDIMVINTDGTNQTNLTDTELDSEFLPAWSPDGAQIMFPMFLEYSSGFGLSIMNADGSEREVLLDSLGGVYPPRIRWSPDGSQVAFSLATGMMTHILIVKTDGSPPFWLTENLDARNSGVSWSPDGKKLVFHSDFDMNDNIYTINADGSHLIKLTGRRQQE